MGGGLLTAIGSDQAERALADGGVEPAIDAELATLRGLEVCGATYRGVGIPAVIASADAAVQRLLADWTSWRRPSERRMAGVISRGSGDSQPLHDARPRINRTRTFYNY